MDRVQPMDARTGLLPLPRPLMTGEVLDAAFRLFRAGLLRCLPYSGLAVLVLQLPTLYSTLLAETPHSRVLSPLPVELDDERLILIAALLLGVLLLGVITLRLQAVSRGQRPRFRTEIATAVVRWPAALIATLGALGLPALLYTFFTTATGIMALGAFTLLVIPLLWPAAMLTAVLPAFWCDRLGPFAALARALRISRGQTWRVIGAILATLCLVAVFYVFTGIIAAMLAQLLRSADLVLIATVRSLMALVVGAFGVPFALSVLIVAYEDLKLRSARRRA
jgi:hypothetical protein